MTASRYTFVDTHCHLMLEDFDTDRSTVIEEAQTLGVNKILVPGIDIPSSRRAISLARKFPGLRVAVGVHPHNASAWNETAYEELAELAQADEVIAIGEIGLDYYRDLSPRSKQMEAFEAQMDIARSNNLPIVVHQRRSIDDVLSVVTSWAGSLDPSRSAPPGVLHAFSGILEQGLEAIRAGFYLGVGGPITFKNAEDTRNITRKLPLDSILLETDAPYLSPVPFRGKRNKPGRVRIIAEKLAEIIGQQIGVVADTTTRNAELCFGW